MTDSAVTGMSRRAVLVGATLALGAGSAWAMTPRKTEKRLGSAKLNKLVPDRIGSWEMVKRDGVVVASEDEDAPVEGYDQVLTRTYAAAGQPEIMLLIAYGSTQGGSLQLHRPETCYPGQGFSLGDFSETQADMGGQRQVAMRSFTARRDQRVERVIYWTRVAEQFPLNTAELYAVILTSVLKGIVPDGVLVRVSTTDPIGPKTDQALAAFAKTMIQSMAPPARKVLVS